MNPSAVPPEQPLVLRERLPLPRPYVAPRTPTEQQLAQIWRIALSMDRVGVEDDYSHLGGDSFLATIIFGMIEEQFHVVIPMAAIVEAATVAKLAQKIDVLLPSAEPQGQRS